MTVKKTKLSRREMLRTSFWAGTALLPLASSLTSLMGAPIPLPASVLGRADIPAPNSRIALGHIGVGNQGGYLFRNFQASPFSQSVAVCDCFKSRRENYAKICKGTPYFDFREMFDKEDLDGVVIATPDHWHLLVGLYAVQHKISTYIEKPLGLTIEQVLLFEKTAAENKVRFQYGTQQRSQKNCWLGCELVRNGVLGKIVKIEVEAPNGHGGGSTAEAPIPPDLGEEGYERWLGPAPKKPYTVDRCRPDGTYMIYDQSIGYLGGWGAHPLDIMIWGSDADLSGPITVEGTGDIDEKGLLDAVYNWNMKMKLGETEVEFKPGGDRTRFIGESGDWIEVRRAGTSASRPELLETKTDAENPTLQISFDRGHYTDFAQGIRDGYDPVSSLKDAVRSDLISHLCDLSIRTGAKLTWDPVKKEFIDAPEDAKKRMSRSMRAPWSLDEFKK